MRRFFMPNRAGAVAVLALVMVLLAAGCGGDDDAAATTAAPTETTQPTTTQATTSTSTTQATTTQATTTQATTTTEATTTTTQATTTTIDTNALASGSGCTPGAGELPDGVWFGIVGSTTATDFEFDLACWFTGDAAVLASAEDGEESPPPNDYYVRNANPELRTVEVAANAEVIWLPNVGDPSSEATVAYAAWLNLRVDRGVELQPGVWITVTDGEVVEIREQYVP